MRHGSRPTSLSAARAVRILRERGTPVASSELVQLVLATRVPDEATATSILETAFAGDPRLRYEGSRWTEVELQAAPPLAVAEPRERPPTPADELDRAFVELQGERARASAPLRLTSVAVVRMRGDQVLDSVGGQPGPALRRAITAALAGSFPIVHDPVGAWRALELWLDEPLPEPLSLRRLAVARLGMPARHTLPELAARLGIGWRETADVTDRAGALAACLDELSGADETLEDLLAVLRARVPPVPWGRYSFDRSFLREVPHTPGTYRFYDGDGALLYVGKSANLHRRLASYFQEGRRRSARVQALLDALVRVEVEPVGSDLEAMLREARQIARARPRRNVQRRFHVRLGRSERLASVLILEPAAAPWVLRAYLLRDGCLVGRVGIGGRGGGLRRIERLLDDHFFSAESRPAELRGDPVDVEIVGRWLAAHRDEVVALDPTDLRSAREVADRLRWFLRHGALRDPDGRPILTR